MTVMATFLGRQAEHDEITALLGQHSVVTLVGPGGIGKTRLATELSSSSAPAFAGGVLFTELAGVSDRDDIGDLVAGQHGFGSIESMRLSASAAPMLVVLDNCETVLRQASDVAAELVGDGAITVLATSRAPLQLYGERIYVVDPLELPRDEQPATVREAASARLFLERAEAAGARWPISDDNLLAIGHLVRQLDGLPLAIELAAARSRTLSPPELVAQLDRQLDLLTRPGEGATARHASLRSAIQTSYDPLDDDLQRCFRALAVFSAPFDLELAHGVAGTSDLDLDTLDRIDQLVAGSLVDARIGEEGAAQYRLLDSIRAFGLEQLAAAGEQAELDERYIETVVDFADRITVEGLKAFSPEVLGSIRRRFVHLTQAIERCVERDDTPDRAYRLFIPMYGPTGARTEVAALGERVRERWTEPAPLEAEALAVISTVTFLRGDSEGAQPLAEQAVAHPDGSALAQMIGHRVLGFIATQNGDHDHAMTELQAAVDLAIPFSGSFARELQASWGAVCSDPARSPEVLEVLAGVRDVARSQNENVTAMWAILAIAHHHHLLGRTDEARADAFEAVAMSTETGFPWSIGAAHRMLGSVLVITDDWAAAAPHFRTSLDHTVTTGDIEGAVVTLLAAAAGAQHLGDTALAEALWTSIPEGRGRPVIPSFFAAEEAMLTERLGRNGPGRVAEMVEECRRLLGPPHDQVDASEAAEAAARAPATGSVLRFGDCELDLDMRELRRDGDRVHIEPQVYELLVFLIDRRGTVAAKEEILDEVWGDRFVSESALTSRIKSARKATGDDGRTQGVIRTVHGHGYSFVAEIEPA